MVMSIARAKASRASGSVNFLEMNPTIGLGTSAQNKANFDLLQDAVVRAHDHKGSLYLPSIYDLSDRDNVNQDFRYHFESQYDVVATYTGTPDATFLSATSVKLPAFVHPQRLRVIFVASGDKYPTQTYPYGSTGAAGTWIAGGTLDAAGLCDRITLGTAMTTGDTIIIRAMIAVGPNMRIYGDGKQQTILRGNGCSLFLVNGNYTTAGVTGATYLVPTGQTQVIFENMGLRGEDDNGTEEFDWNMAISFDLGQYNNLANLHIEDYAIGVHVRAPAANYVPRDVSVFFNKEVNVTSGAPCDGLWIEENFQATEFKDLQVYGETSGSASGDVKPGKAADASAAVSGDPFVGADANGRQNYGGSWQGPSGASNRYYVIATPLGDGGRRLARAEDVVVYFKANGATNWERLTHVAVSAVPDHTAGTYSLRNYDAPYTEIAPAAHYRTAGNILRTTAVDAVEIDLGVVPANANDLFAFGWHGTSYESAVRGSGSALAFNFQAVGGCRAIINSEGLSSCRFNVVYAQICDVVADISATDHDLYWYIRQGNESVHSRFNIAAGAYNIGKMHNSVRAFTELRRTSGTQSFAGNANTQLQFDSSEVTLNFRNENECPREIFYNLEFDIENSSTTGYHYMRIRLERDLGLGDGFAIYGEHYQGFTLSATATKQVVTLAGMFADQDLLENVNSKIASVAYRITAYTQHANSTVRFLTPTNAYAAFGVREVDIANSQG